MKSKSEELYLFVDKLSTYEKTFLSKQLNKHSITETLYNFIVKSKNCSDKLVLKNISSISKETIKHAKQTLFHFLFRKLELFYSTSEKTIHREDEISRLIVHVKICRNKQLIKKGLALTVHAIKKAELNACFLLQLQLLNEQRFFYYSQINSEKFNFLIEENKRNQFLVLKNYKELTDKTYILDELRKINVLSGYFPKETKKDFAKAILRKQILKYGKKIGDYHPVLRLFYYNILYYCYLILNDFEKAIINFNLFLKVYFESKGKIIDVEDFLMCLNEGVSICVLSKNLDLFYNLNEIGDHLFENYSTLEKTKTVITNYYTFKNNKIAFLTHIEDFENARLLSLKIAENIMKEELNFSIQKIFLANLCQVNLCLNKTKEALSTLNKIKNNTHFDDVRTDINPGLRVLELAIFYNLSDFDKIESVYRSVQRDPLLKNENNAFHLVVQAFVLLLKNPTKETFTKVFSSTLIELEEIKKKDLSSHFFLENTLIEYWIKSNLSS